LWREHSSLALPHKQIFLNQKKLSKITIKKSIFYAGGTANSDRTTCTIPSNYLRTLLR